MKLSEKLADKTANSKARIFNEATHESIAVISRLASIAADDGKTSVTVDAKWVNTSVIEWSEKEDLKHTFNDGSPEEGNMAGRESHTFSWEESKPCTCQRC
jgi:hypothetical protein